MQRSDRSLIAGLVAGAAGGAIGTIAFTAFQVGSLRATRASEDATGAGHAASDQQQDLLKMFEEAHAKTADAVAEAAGAGLSAAQRKAAVPFAEFAFGIVCAAAYGALAEYVPAVTAGTGTAYGAVLFTGASLIVLPAIGFVPAAADRMPIQHAGGLAGNVFYGYVTEVVRRAFR